MGKYAVVRLNGKQYQVQEGQELLVDKMLDTKVLPEVLLVSDGESVSVGKPTVKSAKVAIKVVKDVEKGVKVDIYKYKAKSRYKKHIGFRPQHTRILVEKISI